MPAEESEKLSKDYVSSISGQLKPSAQNVMSASSRERLVQRPSQRIFIDFLGPLPRSKGGNTFIFIVLDQLTTYVWLKALPKASSSHVVKFLITEVFHKFGKQFVSMEFANLVKNFGVNHIRTAIHSPQVNSSEGVNQSILEAIRSYLKDDPSNLDNHLLKIEYFLRSSVHLTIGVTPYFALFGMNMIGHGNVYGLARKLQLLDDSENHIKA